MARRMVSPGERQPEPVKIPHDPINEQIILIAARVDPSVRAKLVARLRPDIFLVAEHIKLWIALSELVRRKLDYSPETIRQVSGGEADPEYLDGLVLDRGEEVPPNLDYHVQMLEWDRTRADVVRGPLTQLLRGLESTTTAPEMIRASAQAVADSLQKGTTSGLLRDPSALVRSSMVEMRSRRLRACYPYGLAGLDRQDDGEQWRMIPGAAPGKVTVITGVPGSGKSTVAARCALAQAAAGRRVLFAAWEPGDEDTLQLLAAMKLGISRYSLSTAVGFGEVEEERLEQTMEELAQQILFMAIPGMALTVGSHTARGEKATNERALDQIHAAISDTGAEVAFFDLWKRCLRQADPEEEELALVRQQAIFAQTKCHGILLQQQRLKDIESRQDKRPTREGIKGSGAWVEIADTILGIHRPALWKRVDDVVLEIDVLKQRWGPWPIAVEFQWDSALGSITGGATISYDQPSTAPDLGAVGVDEFLGQETGKKSRKKRGSA